MTTDVYDFLEHRGVKGMKWGHRKARPNPVYIPRGSPQPQKKDHSTRNAVAITAAIIAGASVAGIILGRQANNRKMKSLAVGKKDTDDFKKIMEGIKKVKVATLKPPPGSSWEKIPNFEKLRVPGGSWEPIPGFNKFR